MTHTTPYSRHYTSFTPHSETYVPSHVIKAGLVTLNAHNIVTCQPFVGLRNGALLGADR
jgi:hypothetical protein